MNARETSDPAKPSEFVTVAVDCRKASISPNIHSTSSSSAACSGFRLCFALRPAGLAFSSGFARLIGCPGGASGFLMPSKIGCRACFLEVLPEIDLVAISAGSCVKLKFAEITRNAIPVTQQVSITDRGVKKPGSVIMLFTIES